MPHHRCQDSHRSTRPVSWVVEDNAEVGRFATDALRELGHETKLAVDARAALEMIARNDQHFDVVFSDVVMPGMSGIELGKELRRRNPELPVVLASGYSSALAESGTHGSALIQKPYSIDELSDALQNAVAQANRSPEDA